jgi:hypothetical protein
VAGQARDCGDELVPSPGFALSDPRLDYSLDQGCRQWLVDREVDGSFGSGETMELILKHFNDRGRWKQTAVVCKSGKPHQNACFVPEGRNAIADGLDGVLRHGGPNHTVHLDQLHASGGGSRSEVFRKIFWSGTCFLRRTATSGFRLFHGSDAIGTMGSRLCLLLS